MDERNTTDAAEEYTSDTHIICPYCQHQHEVDLSSDCDEDGFSMDCEKCRKNYNVYPECSWSWTTEQNT